MRRLSKTELDESSKGLVEELEAAGIAVQVSELSASNFRCLARLDSYDPLDTYAATADEAVAQTNRAVRGIWFALFKG